MSHRGQSGLSPGDIGDPVADSIRAQQNRDAMPHPSEVTTTLECESCGVESDDVERRELVMASCSALQHPDQLWTALCSDCDEDRSSLREQHRKKAQTRIETEYYDDPVAIAFYECGRGRLITENEPDEPLPPRMREPPTAPIRCACGDPVVDVEFLGADDEDDE